MLRAAALLFALVAAAAIQAAPPLPPLPVDQGAAGAYQKIRKLQTIASLLHTTAHPDDEHSGMLTWASRGLGARTMLATLNRGEAGDNAIGSELFDALGLIRTDELARAGQYYGLDAQYFTLVADYGYSKRLDEAFTEWDREALLRDLVRIIRHARPLVVVSRWQGSSRDGHGQHQAAGAITPPAVEAAADPARFPELAREGLRPWRVRKLYLGGARENETWHVRVDPGAYDPVVGESYQNLGRLGLSLQRSQTSGRLVTTTGPAPLYYTRAGAPADAGREPGLFDGIDTSLSGAAAWAGADAARVGPALEAVAAEARAALDTFTFTNPSAAAPALARGLAAARRAHTSIEQADIRHLLDVKIGQFEEALAAVLALELSAIAMPADAPEPSGRFAAFAPPVVLDPVTPGEPIAVRVTASARGPVPVTIREAAILGPSNLIVPIDSLAGPRLSSDTPRSERAAVTVPADAPLTRPYFTRRSIAETRYEVVNPAGMLRPFAPPAFTARVTYEVDGVAATIEAPVVRREAQLPYGHALRELEVLPPVSLTVTPPVLVLPQGDSPEPLAIVVEALAHAAAGASGSLSVAAPDGWRVTPASAPFSLASAGARARQSFTVTPAPGVRTGEYRLQAAAESGGRRYTTGYQVIRHRDLPLRYLVRDAQALVAAFPVTRVPGVRVGYVMGVGDELPAALEQLGAEVTLLDREALTSGPLDRFDAIMTGTRAYAVRDDLRANNARLLEWVKTGGRMIVLYNTPEFVPSRFAPYPGELPGNAEEVSEQRAAVEILQPAHPFFTRPNRITDADFDGWIEQRGSKFFSSWDDRYTALVSSHDQGQAPQQGGWLTTTYGKGTWTYMAYALHRQVPYGVPGAYRILANLIAK